MVLLPNANFQGPWVDVGDSPGNSGINPADGELDLDVFTEALNTSTHVRVGGALALRLEKRAAGRAAPTVPANNGVRRSLTSPIDFLQQNFQAPSVTSSIPTIVTVELLVLSSGAGPAGAPM